LSFEETPEAWRRNDEQTILILILILILTLMPMLMMILSPLVQKYWKVDTQDVIVNGGPFFPFPFPFFFSATHRREAIN